MDVLVIGSVALPVKSLTITKNPTWSKNTGRAAEGTMLGDIICRKMKLQITFAPLSDEQAAQLDEAITPAFFPVKFKNPGTAAVETHTMYAGTPAYPVYSYVSGFPRYVGTGVNLIEQ